MNYSRYYNSIFSTKLNEYCSENDIQPDECESLVSQWLMGIQKIHRPTVAGVVMNAKRINWNAELIF